MPERGGSPDAPRTLHEVQGQRREHACCKHVCDKGPAATGSVWLGFSRLCVSSWRWAAAQSPPNCITDHFALREGPKSPPAHPGLREQVLLRVCSTGKSVVLSVQRGVEEREQLLCVHVINTLGSMARLHASFLPRPRRTKMLPHICSLACRGSLAPLPAPGVLQLSSSERAHASVGRRP